MTTTDRIITAVHVGDGAYVDGTNFNELLELTMKSGVISNTFTLVYFPFNSIM